MAWPVRISVVEKLGRRISIVPGPGAGMRRLQLGKLDLASPACKLMPYRLAAVAEMQRDLLVKRTQSGLARAKAAGKALDRPAKTTNTQREEIAQMFAGGASISALSRTFGVSRASIMRIAKPAQAA